MSSGRRITDAGDHPTGLSIAHKLAVEAVSQGTLQRGIQDGRSLAQTGDAGLGSVGGDVARIRELAVQSANGMAPAEQRAAAQAEIDQRREDIDRVASARSSTAVRCSMATQAQATVPTWRRARTALGPRSRSSRALHLIWA